MLMTEISTLDSFYNFLFILSLIGLVVFIALYFVDAGYGKMRTEKWGPAINNKVGWCLMEMPVFFVMLYLWAQSNVKFEMPYLIFFLIFQFHYFQRSFIFPFLLKGNSKMPLVIMGFSVIWNLMNGYIQGYWLFHLAPVFTPNLYTMEWLTDPRFLVGVAIFIIGWVINMHSDHVIRHLRKPGDTNHYLPKGGMFDYVTSANYFGELLEWTGFAIILNNPAAWLFVWWTAANLVPRAHSINKKYRAEFGNEQVGNRKRVIPFVY